MKATTKSKIFETFRNPDSPKHNRKGGKNGYNQ